MKEGKYAKTLAKIQVTAIFLTQDMRRNFLRKVYRDLDGGAMLVHIQMSQMGTRHGGRKPTEVSATEFATIISYPLFKHDEV